MPVIVKVRGNIPLPLCPAVPHSLSLFHYVRRCLPSTAKPSRTATWPPPKVNRLLDVLICLPQSHSNFYFFQHNGATPRSRCSAITPPLHRAKQSRFCIRVLHALSPSHFLTSCLHRQILGRHARIALSFGSGRIKGRFVYQPSLAHPHLKLCACLTSELTRRIFSF